MKRGSRIRSIMLSLVAAMAGLLLLPVLYAGAQSATPLAQSQISNTDGLAYITLSDSDLVAAVHTIDYTVPYTIDVGAAGCDFPWRAALSPGGEQLLVSCRWSGSIVLIDTATQTVVDSVDDLSGAAGSAFTWDGDKIVIGSRDLSRLTVMNTSTLAPVYLSTPAAPLSVATHPYRNLAYAALTNGSILVVDTENMEAVATIPFGSRVWDIAVSPDGQWVYASDRWGAGLVVIDTGSNTIHTTVSGLGNLNGIAVAPDGSALYAGELYSGIHTIDTTTFAATGFASIPDTPWELDVTCDGSRLFAGNTTGEVVVVNTSTQTVLSVPLPGMTSRGVAVCPPTAPAGVRLLPAQAHKQAALGESVTYELTLLHLEQMAHSYTVSVESSDWPASMSTTTIGPLTYGEEVTFTVEVTVPEDARWYEQEETVVSVTSTSDADVNDSARMVTTAYAPPEVSVSPDTVTASQAAGEVTTHTAEISNENGVTTTFEVEALPVSYTPLVRDPELAGGPDAFGYTYRDSEEADGPEYEWEDISTSGTAISFNYADDTYLGPVPLGFSFDFYGNSYEEIYVGSNGYLSFGGGSGTIPYTTIPSSNLPNNIVALFGGDMYLASDSAVYYETLQNPTRFVLMYVDLYYCCSPNTAHTLEVILYPNGNILSQYHTLNGTSSDYVGIEDEEGEVGLAYSGTLQDGLAICYAYPGNSADCRAGDVPWLIIDPSSGTVAPNSTETVELVLDARGVQPGTYVADVLVKSDDPAGTEVVAVTMEVAPTASMGQVSGTVVDAWHGTPLTATVRLADVYTTTAQPDYTIWAEAGSYEMEVAAPGYVTETETVTITAGSVTSLDPALEPAQSRLELAVEVMTETTVAGTTVSKTLTISNTGPMPLDVTFFELTPTLQTRSPAATTLEGSMILFDAAHGGSSIYDFSTLVHDLEFAGATVVEHFTTIDADALQDVDILWTNCCGATWTEAELNALSSWLEQGGAVLVHGQASNSTEAIAGLFGIEYEAGSCIAGVTTLLADHPLNEGVESVALPWTCDALLSPAGTTEVVTDQADERARVVAQVEGVGRMVVSASSLFFDWEINGEDNRQLATNTFAWLATPTTTEVEWLTVIPDSLTVAGHSSETVTVRFDTADLQPGSYDAPLGLVHNDPDREMVSMPINLTVGTAGFEVAPAELALELTTGETGELEIGFTQTGTVPAGWTLVADENLSWLSLNPSDGSLAPTESVTVTLLLDASGLGPGTYETTLHLALAETGEEVQTIPVALTVKEATLYLPLIAMRGG